MQSKKCRYTSIRICITQSNYVEQIVTGINVWSKVTSWSKHNDKENEEYTAVHITQRFHQQTSTSYFLCCFAFFIKSLIFPFLSVNSNLKWQKILSDEMSHRVSYIISYHILDRSLSLFHIYVCICMHIIFPIYALWLCSDSTAFVSVCFYACACHIIGFSLSLLGFCHPQSIL